MIREFLDDHVFFALASVLILVFVSFSAFGAERFHCYTRVTYQHIVYSNRCYNNEVLVGVISQNYPTRVICAKLEVDCTRKEEIENASKD